MVKKLLKLKIRFLKRKWNLLYNMMCRYANEMQKLRRERDEIIDKIKLVQEELNIAEEEYNNYK